MIKQIRMAYKVLKKKTEDNKLVNKDNLDTKITQNINGLDCNVNDYISYQVRILGKLKYFFLYPLIQIGMKLGGRFLVDKVPTTHPFRNYKADEKAYETALVKWHDTYIQDLTWGKKIRLAWIKNLFIAIPYKTLQAIQKLKLTLLMSDSAYFEFHNIYLLELYKELGKIHGEQPVHVLYKNKSVINDPVYFVAVKEGSDVILRKRVETLRPYYNASGVMNLRFQGDNVGKVLELVANELDCVPKREVLLEKIKNIKLDALKARQALIGINGATVDALQGGRK